MVTETRGLHITAQNFLPYIPVAWKTRHSSFSDWARGIRSEQGPLISTYSHYSVQKLTTLTFLFSCQFLNPPPHPLFYSLLLLSPHPSLSLTLLSNLPPQWPPLPRNSPLSNPPSPDWTKSGLAFSQFQSFTLLFPSFSSIFVSVFARIREIGTWFVFFSSFLSVQWEWEERIHQPRRPLSQVNQSITETKQPLLHSWLLLISANLVF